jgi:glycosyltransferase involved in cell wall biosynthesis
MKKSIKILHVLAGLEQGGIEKWLVHLTAEFQKQSTFKVESEFLTFIQQGGYYERTLKAMGCEVHHCQLVWMKLPVFLYKLLRFLKKGRYDVVHCHADYLSGLILPAAHAAGVGVRICHVHNTQFAFQRRRPLLRFVTGLLLRRLVLWDGGLCLGTSSSAIEAFLDTLKGQISTAVCLCGIPCSEYRAALTKRAALDRTFGGKVVIHIGRHVEQKNPLFLLEIFAGLIRRDADVVCWLVGKGPLSESLKARTGELGIEDRVRFLGQRDDVAHLLTEASLLLLPSLWEGLGLVAIEAQAAGIPSLVSDQLPQEVEVVDGLVHRLSIHSPVSTWVDTALELLKHSVKDRLAVLQIVEKSAFSISGSARALLGVYTGEGADDVEFRGSKVVPLKND